MFVFVWPIITIIDNVDIIFFRNNDPAQEFIADVRGVLLSSSRVPGVGAALSENILGAFGTVLERLDQANAATNTTTTTTAAAIPSDAMAQQAQRLANDAATLCALMPVTSAAAAGGGGAGGGEGGGGRELIMRAGEALVQAAGTMAAAGLYTRGPEFAALQVREEGG